MAVKQWQDGSVMSTILTTTSTVHSRTLSGHALGSRAGGAARDRQRAAGHDSGALRVSRPDGGGGGVGALRGSMAENGHAARPLIWERYLVGPGVTPAPLAWQTELN